LIVRSPSEYVDQLDAGWLSNDASAVPRAVFLVEPTDFKLSRQSAIDNNYMDLSVKVDPDRALFQHRKLTARISSCGVPVIRFPGNSATPDDVFPNNVFGTIPGRLIIGSMLYPERQAEAARDDIRGFFKDLMGYEVMDLSGRNLVAELTGALVMDRSHRVGYCGMTQRVDDAGCLAMHDAFDLALTFQFDLTPEEYHTNVVLTVLASRACIICPESFVDPEVPKAIARAFPDRTLIITPEEKAAFAGNCLAMNFTDVFISQTAVDIMDPAKIRRLESWGFNIHPVELDEIEKAGGSLRCCVAEIY